jgi:hypothetical protein
VLVAVLDGHNLDIRCLDKNSELDGLQHVNFFCLVNVVLKALQQETVEATAIIGLKIVDDAGITRNRSWMSYWEEGTRHVCFSAGCGQGVP